MEEVIIRTYNEKDYQAVREIAYDTAFLGDSANSFFDDRELLEDFLTAYFIDYEPESCFVAEIKGIVIGYLIGLKNTHAVSVFSRFKIFLKLLHRAITNNIIFRRKSMLFVINCIKSFIKGEFKAPDFSKDYPATLHINIKEDFRNRGIGEKLINTYLNYLVKEKIKGIHFATLSERAAHFYRKLGFVLLYECRRSYFRNILHKNVIYYVFGKKLVE